MDITTVINTLFVICLWLMCWLFVLFAFYTSDLKKLLLEPMLNYPVIIFESDDWGVGPLKQKEALEQIIKLLSGFCDTEGHPPVMTLGIILAEPDIEKIKQTGGEKYRKRTIADDRYNNILKVIKRATEQGVFSVQLHGLEHYWPESIMRSINRQPQVKRWLFDNNEKQTEDLPSELQSRWVDSSSLPSLPHSQEDINTVINEELLLYKKIFGRLPGVVVPPTFVWTDTVEQAYADRGMQAMVTPGRQCVGRDITGKLETNGRSFFNGQESTNGLLYLVRNDYFEPSLGHKAETVWECISQKVICGRPALLEMHRFNFINGQENNTTSLAELDRLLQLIKSHLTDVKYISTEHLAKILRDYNQGNDSEFITSSLIQRFKIAMARIKLFFQYNRLAKYSGVNLLLKLL